MNRGYEKDENALLKRETTPLGSFGLRGKFVIYFLDVFSNYVTPLCNGVFV